MSLFRKKCMYCREKIDKGQEQFANIKIIGYVGTFNRPFCSEEHINKYNEEIKNRSQKKGGCCCG
ncbi:MAG: hypothetical protein ISS25_03840 [Nanoarchaeota archaeon]|nr:hypothetical protein [DPANN group archaeon]MBL7116935.1 hypothetical protein [Nanoarchaeota archaeon]